MITLLIKKSRRQTVNYLLLSLVLLSFVTYFFLTDKTTYPKGNSFYWIAIVLFGLTSVYFLFEYFDKTPLYVLTTEGISRGKSKKIIHWKDLSYFKCQSPYQKYVTKKVAILYDRSDNEVFTIDFSASEISLDEMNRILKKKILPK
jgi:hypothetical protein